MASHPETGLPAASAPAERIQDASDPDVCWFALWTRSRHEQVVREQLQRKHLDVFLPTVTRWSRWKDRKKKIDWPLFPGRSEEHTSELQSLRHLVCRLLLEKKK